MGINTIFCFLFKWFRVNSSVFERPDKREEGRKFDVYLIKFVVLLGKAVYDNFLYRVVMPLSTMVDCLEHFVSFFHFILFHFPFYPPDSQESDGAAILKDKQLP